MSITKQMTAKSAWGLALYLTLGRGEERYEHLDAGTDRALAMTCDMGDEVTFADTARDLARRNGRRAEAYHLVQAFEVDELDPTNPADVARAHDAGVALARRYAPHSPVMVVTHADGENGNLHNHVMVMNHDLESSRAFTGMHPLKLQAENDDVMREHGLRVYSPREWPERRRQLAESRPSRWAFHVQVGDAVAAALDDPGSTDVLTFRDALAARGVTMETKVRRGREVTQFKARDETSARPRLRRVSAETLSKTDFSDDSIAEVLALNRQLAESENENVLDSPPKTTRVSTKTEASGAGEPVVTGDARDLDDGIDAIAAALASQHARRRRERDDDEAENDPHPGDAGDGAGGPGEVSGGDVMSFRDTVHESVTGGPASPPPPRESIIDLYAAGKSVPPPQSTPSSPPPQLGQGEGLGFRQESPPSRQSPPPRRAKRRDADFEMGG